MRFRIHTVGLAVDDFFTVVQTVKSRIRSRLLGAGRGFRLAAETEKALSRNNCARINQSVAAVKPGPRRRHSSQATDWNIAGKGVPKISPILKYRCCGHLDCIARQIAVAPCRDFSMICRDQIALSQRYGKKASDSNAKSDPLCRLAFDIAREFSVGPLSVLVRSLFSEPRHTLFVGALAVVDPLELPSA